MKQFLMRLVFLSVASVLLNLEASNTAFAQSNQTGIAGNGNGQAMGNAGGAYMQRTGNAGGAYMQRTGNAGGAYMQRTGNAGGAYRGSTGYNPRRSNGTYHRGR